MIWASCRRQHWGGSILVSRRLTWSGEPIESVEGRRVVILVHGVKNTVGQVERAYNEAFNRSRASFDAAIGFIWPGGATPVAYPFVSLIQWRQAVDHLRDVIELAYTCGAASVDVDAHSLGVPLTLEAVSRCNWGCDGVSLKAGAMPRDLSKYRKLTELVPPVAINVFFSRRDPIVRWLYRFWWPFRGALGAYGERTPGGNIGTQHDCTEEVDGHTDYRHSNVWVQAMTDLTKQRSKRDLA